MRISRRAGAAGLRFALLLLLAWPGAAAAGAVEDLQGSWATAAGAPTAMQWAGDAGGFTVAWTPIGGRATSVRFTPAGRPNVFTGRAKDGWSLMASMFGDDGPANPLKGDALYWARTAPDGVYLYRMEIDDHGAFTIDRYALRPAGDGLDLAVDRRTAEGGSEIEAQRLVRTAP